MDDLAQIFSGPPRFLLLTAFRPQFVEKGTGRLDQFIERFGMFIDKALFHRGTQGLFDRNIYSGADK